LGVKCTLKSLSSMRFKSHVSLCSLSLKCCGTVSVVLYGVL